MYIYIYYRFMSMTKESSSLVTSAIPQPRRTLGWGNLKSDVLFRLHAKSDITFAIDAHH